MSQLIRILYEVSQLRNRYEGAHRNLCGLSPQRLIAVLHGKQAQQAQLENLREIRQQLRHKQGELERLDAEEIARVRRGREIRPALSDYISALLASMDRLEILCRLALDAGEAETSRGQAKIAYDDAVQHHRRLASQLNQLIRIL